MDSTDLTLMTAEGPLKISFRPMLEAEQYNTLSDFLTTTQLTSKRDFVEFLGQLAAEWGSAFEADGLPIRAKDA